MRWILIISIILYSRSSVSQQIELPITFRSGTGSFAPLFFKAYEISKNNLLTKNIKKFTDTEFKFPTGKEYVIWFDAPQFFYQEHLKGNIPRADYDSIVNVLAIKSMAISDLSTTPTKCYIKLLAWKSPTGEMNYIIDNNFNNSISDDTAHIAINEDYEDDSILSAAIIKTACERLLFNKIVPDTAKIIIATDGDDISYCMAEHATATLIEPDNKVDLSVASLYLRSRNYRNAELIAGRRDHVVDPDSTIKKGEYFFTSKRIYQFSGIDLNRNILVLKEIKSAEYYSPQTGFFAPVFSDRDIVTSDLVALSDYRGKFVFIDFWGTWCAPCRKELPYLKKTFTSIDTSRIEMISIAVDDDMTKVKNFVVKERMAWRQLYSNKIRDNYAILAYPTNFIIDPRGKIVAKNVGAEALADKLNELIKDYFN